MTDTMTVNSTNPFGWCFVSYRRARLAEIHGLVCALHELGIPTWQDLDDLDEQPLEAALRGVLDDPNTASGVVWVTPEVADSPIITNLEIPGLTRRAADPAFALIPIAAGGLDYNEAATVARSATTLTDLGTWNIGKVPSNPATAGEVRAVAQRVLRRRVRAIHAHLDPGAPVVVDLYTRTPATHHAGAALTMNLTHLFDGRHAKPGAWETVTDAVRTALGRVATDAPGRPVHLRGLVGLPTAVTLGAAVAAPSGVDASWVQRKPGHPDALYTLHTAAAPSGFAVSLVDSSPCAADVAVLVSVSENTVPAFRATTGLGSFRGIVSTTAPGGFPHHLETPGQALDLARSVVQEVRLARSRYGVIGAVHLFVAGPAGLAFLVGQLLNTLGVVVTYEHVSGTGTGTYVPEVTVEPSG